MNHQELYKFLLTVQKNVRCPQCGKQYDFDGMEIRGIVDQLMFLELHCSDHMPLLATIALNKQQDEAAEKVTTNDVIEIYKFFKKYTGTFSEIFSEKPANDNLAK